MIDQSKRNTLKNAAAIGTAAMAASASVLASGLAPVHTNTSSASLPLDDTLIDIKIGARLSSTTHDLEVVVTNNSTKATTITAMTPAEINTVRGRFDFKALFDAGDLRIAAGENVIVPIQHHAVMLDNSSIDERATALTQKLRRSVSIITNGDSFAATTVAKVANFA